MNDASWHTYGLIGAGALALVVLLWVFVVLRRDRAHDKGEQLRSDAAVDSALARLLTAYDKAIGEPTDAAVFAVEQRLKDLLLVVVSFEEVDEDFHTLPQALEDALVTIENMPGTSEEVRREQLQADRNRLNGYHQQIERILTRESAQSH
ncbi:hypothetical protein [Ferrimonas balearica]|uniref:hypothetical protein n=1 Tax=Ferrimonas balearica TaxID=44012 RepID=UPI001C582843|nr:hypothetical protein [Ferrimonas balearica]MBW3141574.1 hypothetical protein [Ferrimonas balearica]MBW3166542.1 hypothetical protein [Ferrimonas balearica]MBY5982280.1 hypothetical protein [Ferrimonas balearica]MBY6226233.1 hypothetical protein [Ferrimonas balearica]